MEEKSSSCWRLIRAIPERKRLPVRRCALLQEEVQVEQRVAIGAARAPLRTPTSISGHPSSPFGPKTDPQ